MKGPRRAFRTVATAAFLVACGGTTSGGSGGTSTGPRTVPPASGTPVAEADFAREVARQGCAAIAACCQQNRLSADQATCETNLERLVQTQVLYPANSPIVTYDANNAGDCVAQFVQTYQTCGAAIVKQPACGHVYVGHVPEGASCTKSPECADPSGGNASCVDGICTVPGATSSTPGALGDPCNATCRTEPAVTFCSSTLSSSGAEPPPGAKSCETTSGLYCDDATYTCAALPALGQPCTTYCAAGAYCDGTRCVAQKASGPCPNYTECNSATYCDVTSAEPTCKPRLPMGTSCQSSTECQSGACRNSVCGTLAPVDANVCAGILDDSSSSSQP
ncbi:MAG TPA: Dickkopf N-terminal cysteine-rich domain-containing protein [Polyangiaceae bacterium]|nr:Dickkopf N-terminal cysteine-rich domain-containing protein [Polyangiaceae bacterium]